METVNFFVDRDTYNQKIREKKNKKKVGDPILNHSLSPKVPKKAR
jgi:hypothetical protein